MADENARELAEREERAFSRKDNLHALWQELALNFYSARADFTAERTLGEEYAIDQFDSEPERCRRDLADARASMLRPEGQQWVKAETRDKDFNEANGKALDFVNERLRYFISESEFGVSRAEKEADNDLVSFGNAIKSAESDVNRAGERKLIVRSWHPRDCAWFDDEAGTRQDVMFRRVKMSARHMERKFKRAVFHQEVIRALEKEPDKEFRLCHVMMPTDEYDYIKRPSGKKQQWASIYYDSEHRTVLLEESSGRFRYVVDRWSTMQGSQYGYSPATMVGIADARMLQTVAMILQEASEKSLDPPVTVRKGALAADEVDMTASGVTWIDANYDERNGDPIKTLLPDRRQVPIGIDMIARLTIALRDSFYLSKLKLPTQAKTAFETQALLEQFIRENLPLFGPWQAGVSMMCDEIFAALTDKRYIRDAFDDKFPTELLGRELTYTFQNPLRDAIEKNKANMAQQAFGLTVAAAQIDQDAAHVPDIPKMLRTAIRGIGAPADFLQDEKAMADKVAAAAQARQFLSAVGTAGQVADVAKTGAEAAQNLTQIGNGQAADTSFSYGPQ